MSSSARRPVQYVPAGLILRNPKKDLTCLLTANGKNHTQQEALKPPRTICKQTFPRSQSQLLNKSPTSLHNAILPKLDSKQCESSMSVPQALEGNQEIIQFELDSAVSGLKIKNPITESRQFGSVPPFNPEKRLTSDADLYDSDDSWGEESINSSSTEYKLQEFDLNKGTAVNNAIVKSNKNDPFHLCNVKIESDKICQASVRNTTDFNKTCGCGKCANFLDCPTWCARNIMFGDLQGGNSRKGMPLLQLEKFKGNDKIQTFYDKNILIYGTYIFPPVQSLEKTVFNPLIQKGLEEINSKELKPLHLHMLVPVLRSLNVVAIGRGTEFENSLIYLPAFYSFALENSQRYSELKYEGPLILIITSEEEKCLKLHSFIKKLLPSTNKNLSVGVLLKANPINCDIIITTPSTVDLHLRLENIKLQRLCHVAIEDASEVFQRNNMEQFFQLLHRIQANRPHNKNLQVVMWSEIITQQLLSTIKLFYSMPIVAFNDFLEAALFCNIEFKYKNINSNHKIFYLTDVLKIDNASEKFVVFCDDSDISTVEKYCLHSGIEYVSVLTNMTKQETAEVTNMWSTSCSDVSKVLLCCDSMLEQIDVDCANRIIHYSAPSTWEEFQRRHRVLSKNLKSPFKNSEGSDIISYIVKDEKSDFFDNFHEIKKRKVLIQHVCNQLYSSL